MEKKEYNVPNIALGIDALKILDSDGNPIKASEPIAYKLIGEDGSTLKEGTLRDDSTISLDDVSTRKFRVVFESYRVIETNGFANLDQTNQASSGKNDANEPHGDSQAASQDSDAPSSEEG